MRKNISLWNFGGFLAVSIMGVLLHFLYEWTGECLIFAPFSGVNESTWEHMKLLYFPLFIFAVIQSSFFKEFDCFWCVKLIGTVAGLSLIPVLFYTYNGVFGKSPDSVNISIFFISAAAAFILEGWLFKNAPLRCRFGRLCFFATCFIGLLFVVFTFFPPEIPLFLDPLTRSFGVIK